MMIAAAAFLVVIIYAEVCAARGGLFGVSIEAETIRGLRATTTNALAAKVREFSYVHFSIIIVAIIT